MNCAEIRSRLDDWAAGRLAESEAGRVAEHLETCGPCRAEARPALALADATSALARSVEPSRDLWPGIDAALDAPAAGAVPWAGRLGARGLAAAAVALVVLTAAATLLLVPGEKTAGPVVATATTEELLRALEARDVSPRTMAVVQRNLAVIDAAVIELEAALAKDPTNEELARMLVSTHQKRAELVDRAARAREDG
jgi:hypothetical protein